MQTQQIRNIIFFLLWHLVFSAVWLLFVYTMDAQLAKAFVLMFVWQSVPAAFGANNLNCVFRIHWFARAFIATLLAQFIQLASLMVYASGAVNLSYGNFARAYIVPICLIAGFYFVIAALISGIYDISSRRQVRKCGGCDDAADSDPPGAM